MSRLVSRMLKQNTVYGTGFEDDVYTSLGWVRCIKIDAIFWRFRGRKFPGRASKATRRYVKFYQRKEREAS